MKKKLYIIDGYRIWAMTYEDAYEHYLVIVKLLIVIMKKHIFILKSDANLRILGFYRNV